MLYIPTTIGTVYLVDTAVEEFDERAVLSVNDLRSFGETWTVSSFSYAGGRLDHRTMKEVICVGSQ